MCPNVDVNYLKIVISFIFLAEMICFLCYVNLSPTLL